MNHMVFRGTLDFIGVSEEEGNVIDEKLRKIRNTWSLA